MRERKINTYLRILAFENMSAWEQEAVCEDWRDPAHAREIMDKALHAQRLRLRGIVSEPHLPARMHIINAAINYRAFLVQHTDDVWKYV